LRALEGRVHALAPEHFLQAVTRPDIRAFALALTWIVPHTQPQRYFLPRRRNTVSFP
jgi:hypothetical protein